MVLARAIRRWEAVNLLVASGGRSGLNAAIDHRPRMVVVEAPLSDMGGEAFVGALREKAMPAGTPIVVVAHEGTPTERARLIWAGATAYLARPLHQDELSRSDDGDAARRSSDDRSRATAARMGSCRSRTTTGETRFLSLVRPAVLQQKPPRVR